MKQTEQTRSKKWFRIKKAFDFNPMDYRDGDVVWLGPVRLKSR